MLKSLVSSSKPVITSIGTNQKRTNYAGGNTLKNKKYKIPLTTHSATTNSIMLLTIVKEKYGNIVADVTFSSDIGNVTRDIISIKENELADIIGKYPPKRFSIRGESPFAINITMGENQTGYKYGSFIVDITFSDRNGITKDITFLQEDELADIIKNYKIFVECIKKEEQKELSSRRKDVLQRLFSRAGIRNVMMAFRGPYLKKVILANTAYMKNAALSTAKLKKVIAELNNLGKSSTNLDTYTNMVIGGTTVVTRSTIELDADIVSIIQKEPEVKNLKIKNFISNIHMINISLSMFFSLHRINQIFLACGMIIGFGRIATTPFSVYYGHGAYLAALVANPIPILFEAVPIAMFILFPRIVHVIIRHKIRKAL